MKTKTSLPVFQLVHSPKSVRSLAYLVLISFATLFVLLLILPWQQTSSGEGRVVAYAPLDRQQTIESPINGRITKWHVVEGSQVKKGDPILDISDNDPDFLERLRQERTAVLQRIEAAKQREESIRYRITALRESQNNAVSAAESRKLMAKDRVNAALQAVDAAEASYKTAKLNLERQRQLLEKGLTSVRNFELSELDYANSRTGLDRARTAYQAALKEEKAFGSDQSRTGTDANAGIGEAKAQLALAQTEVARGMEELPRIDARLSRQSNQELFAPRDGTIMRILANPDVQQVKEGDVIAVLIPDTKDRAVELFVSGNDIPLLSEGRLVRLQFQGWPVLQIDGWPEFAVGTFGGKVSLVDVTDNGSGYFRVLVVPDTSDDPWPSTRYLRQGVRAKGWIFLNRVSLGYELWRRFNDFPQMIPKDEPVIKKHLGDGIDKGFDKGKK